MEAYLKIGSQFSGIGAFEQAFKNLGKNHETIMAVEWDKYARKTYTANFGEPKHFFKDTYDADYMKVDTLDFFLSSPPCQAFSLAGKRLGEQDERGILFYETYRFIQHNHPKYFIIENVKGLLSDNDGATFQNWINLLGQSVNGDQFMFPHEDSLMYNLHWQVLNTKDYGLPQNRERVFLIGIRNDLPNSFVFPKGIPLKLRLKDILEDEVDEKYYLSEKLIAGFMNKPSIESFPFQPLEIDTDKVCPTITARIHKCSSSDPYLKIHSATKSGYEIATEGYSINLEHPNSETRRGRVGKQVAQTLTTSCNQGVVEERIKQWYTDENKDKEEGYIIQTGQTNMKGQRIYKNGVCPTLPAENPRVCSVLPSYRIRKLTTREVFRLQGFPDSFHDKAVEAGVSNSQLYKQAGNSITTNVIEAILKNLLKDYLPNENNQ